MDGHLGCFYVMAIVKSEAMNIGVYVSDLRFFQVSHTSLYFILFLKVPKRFFLTSLLEYNCFKMLC